jgi:hypothetical protein
VIASNVAWRHCACAEFCLPSRCLEAGCINPLFHCCARIAGCLSVRYLAPLRPSTLQYYHVSECDYRRGLDWWVDLLTIHTHGLELQAFTAPPLISTNHKSPQHPLGILQPAASSPAIHWQRLLTVEILELHALKSSLHRLPYRPDYQKTRLQTSSRL